MQFADIEMLDIPDSEVSETESPSVLPAPAAEKSYPLLQEWLAGERDLHFQFNTAAYEDSVKGGSPELQTQYINRLYKILEAGKAGDESWAAHDLGFSGPIGVVSLARVRRVPPSAVAAFSAVAEAFLLYYDEVYASLGDGDARDLASLQAILDCLQATAFYPSEATRPELILKWINSFDPRPENDFIDAVMYSTPTPWKHPQFWTLYLGALLSRGMFTQATASLRASKHEELKDECVALYEIIEDLQTLVGAYAGMAHKGQFSQWKQNVCEFRDNFGTLKSGILDMTHVTVALQIHDLLCLMSGMPKTTALFVQTWYEMYGCLALYQVRDDDSVYDDYFRLAVAEKGYNVADPVDATFRDILLGNYLRVILAIDQCDSPTAAYVSKLFDACGFFLQFYADVGGDKPSDAETRLVSDYLLVRHAFACLESHDLVPVGLGILVLPLVCGLAETSRDVVAEFLPQYSYTTNDDLEWALTICAKLKLPEVSRKLFLRQGLDSLENGHLYEALNMLVKCYDERSPAENATAMEKVHSIVWEDLFADALLNSLPVADELIANVVSNLVSADFPVHPIIRQCLAPYAVLCEYLQAIADPAAFSRCLSSLFHLIRFKYMPEKYVPLLLGQFLPFFEARKFELPQLIIMIELIDTFEMQELGTEEEELFKYAMENVPADAPWDWRVQIEKQGEALPKSIPALIKSLRNKIVRSIGEVYIKS